MTFSISNGGLSLTVNAYNQFGQGQITKRFLTMKRRLVLIGLAMFACGCGSPAGRPSYSPRDDDKHLKPYAQTAVPIISAIEKFESTHSRLPVAIDEFIDETGYTESTWPGWTYGPHENGYTLYFTLGWDPVLMYSSQDQRWVYDPGDGSATTVVKFSGLELTHD
ncbi:MAG: hypothetical protein KDB27_07035 [Planctomycetales bacterium]|nr:hypothetical protein [Planctomycetales bacterium]